MTVSNKEIVLAYRHVYQAWLRAVQYTKPARYVVRDHIRDAFRNSPIEAYDAKRIATTLEFLDTATKRAGIEHRLLKRVMHCWYWRQELARRSARPQDVILRKQAYREFDRMIERLNESLGLCIK